jgi:hypothetical protein
MAGCDVRVAALCCLLAIVAASATCAAEEKKTVAPLEVVADGAVAYEEPDALSAVVRRLYLGEIVEPVERVRSADGKAWFKIRLGKTSFGYVRAATVGPAGELPEGRWKRDVIVRDKRPLGGGVRGYGELFGGAVSLRYLPLTRLGVTFSLGAVFDDAAMKATAFSIGIVSFFATTNLSPMIEAGFSRIGYHSGLSTMRVYAFYLTVGIEWMFDFGMYLHGGVTYIRSMDIDVAVEWENTRDAPVARAATYGKLDAYMRNDVFQAIQPMFGVGYGF